MKLNIHARVRNLVRKHGTRNPERLAEELDIIIIRKEYSPVTKGYFIRNARNKFIVVNIALPEREQEIVLAHELGHALLHSAQDIYFIREYTLFPTGRYEVEANKFASELLISDCEKEFFLERGIVGTSIYLGVPEKLVEYKFLK